MSPDLEGAVLKISRGSNDVSNADVVINTEVPFLLLQSREQPLVMWYCWIGLPIVLNYDGKRSHTNI